MSTPAMMAVTIPAAAVAPDATPKANANGKRNGGNGDPGEQVLSKFI